MALLLMMLCTGCWDMKEINQLSIVSILGIDKDPETGVRTAYYQVINPTGTSNTKGGAAKAAVYTYKIESNSLGLLPEMSMNKMPRLLFTAQLQCYIYSERAAKNGILDGLNYIELNPERRTTALIMVTDSPLSTIMNSYTPLEKVPGRYIRTISDLHAKTFHNGINPIRMKDLAKKHKLHQPTILPILHFNGHSPASKTDKLEKINASTDAMDVSKGAVFVHARMVGKVDYETRKYFNILNNNLKTFVENLIIEGSDVDIQAERVRVKRKWDRSEGKLLIQINADLRIINNQLKNSMSMLNLHKIEEAFNRQVVNKSNTFVQLGYKNDWDFMGIQDHWVTIKDWRKTEILFDVHSKVTGNGNASAPYE